MRTSRRFRLAPPAVFREQEGRYPKADRFGKRFLDLALLEELGEERGVCGKGAEGLLEPRRVEDVHDARVGELQ